MAVLGLGVEAYSSCGRGSRRVLGFDVDLLKKQTNKQMDLSLCEEGAGRVGLTVLERPWGTDQVCQCHSPG